MNLLKAVTSFIMVAVAKAVIIPQNSFNYTMYFDDQLQIPLNYGMFVMSNPLNSTCSVVQSLGNVVYPTDVLTSVDYTPYDFAKTPVISEFINNLTYFAIYDKVNIVVQNITLNHLNFSGGFKFNIPTLANITCTDVELNTVLNRVYVACGTDPQVQSQTFTAYLYEVDYSNGTILNTQTFAVPKISHRLQIKIAPIRSDRGQSTTYVLVYDQGISSGLPETNIWVAILSGANAGGLYNPTIIDLKTTNLNFLSLYDIYSLRGELLVTGKNSAVPTAPIVMAGCSINSNSGQLTFACSNTSVTAPFGTTFGYVGVLNTGQYVEVDINPSNPANDFVYVCNFEGRFGSPNFIDSSNCMNISSFAAPDDVTIAIVEGNHNQVVVKYTHFDGTYAGYSLHSFFLNHSYSHINDANPFQAIPFDTTLVLMNNLGSYLTRQVFPYYFVSFGSQTNATSQNVTVQCSDDTTPATNFTFGLNIMHDMHDMVSANSTVVPQLAAYEGGDLMFGVDPSKILGNDLTLSIQVENPQYASLVRPNILDTEPINLNWRFEKGNTNFRSIRFVGRWAVSHSQNGWVSFSRCDFTGLASVSCIEAGAINLVQDNMHLHKHVYTVFNWVFAFATDSRANITKFFIFDPSSGIVTVHDRGGVVADASISENGNNAILAFAYTNPGVVYGWSFSNIDPTTYTVLLALETHNSGMDVFCPHDIDFDPENGAILEVLSICENDQRILRYVYPPSQDHNQTILRLLGNVPINLAFTNVNYCSMGTEFVVAANISHGTTTQKMNIQAYNLWADRNRWSFGTLTDDLELGNITAFNCVPRVGVFTTLSVNSTGNLNLAIYKGNKQHQANQKVFGSIRGGLDQYTNIESFDLMGATIHVLIPSSGPVNAHFMYSFSTEVLVDLQLLRGIGNSSLGVNMVWTNNLNKVSVHRAVTVTNPYVSIDAHSLKTMNGDPNNVTFCIEDFTQFAGPITDGYLTNHTDAVYLTGRVKTLKPYMPEPEHAQLISQLESFNDITIALHRSPVTNASTFTLFQNVTDFWGTQDPFLPVNAYHFAPFLNTDNNTVFIAYSTAGAVNNTLQFLVLNNTQVQSIGYFSDNQIRNYTKIRVVPVGLGTNNSFMIFAKNRDEQQLHVFRADIVGNRIVPQVLDNIPNVYDFEWAMQPGADMFYVFVLWASNRTNIDFDTFQMGSGSMLKKDTFNLPQKIKESGLGNGFEQYDITSMSARWYAGQSLSLVLNTLSNRIYEVVQGSTLNIYWKLPGFDGTLIDSNKDHIVQLVSSNRQQSTARFVVYKKKSAGGDGNVYWTVHNDVGRAFTMLTCKQGNSHLQIAHPFANAPLWFYTIGKMNLTVGAGASIRGISLQLSSIGGFLPVSYSLESIIDGSINPPPKPQSNSWWPYILIVVLMVLLAVGLISWKAVTDRPARSEENHDHYRSLKSDGTKKTETDN